MESRSAVTVKNAIEDIVRYIAWGPLFWNYTPRSNDIALQTHCYYRQLCKFSCFCGKVLLLKMPNIQRGLR